MGLQVSLPSRTSGADRATIATSLLEHKAQVKRVVPRDVDRTLTLTLTLTRRSYLYLTRSIRFRQLLALEHGLQPVPSFTLTLTLTLRRVRGADLTL